MWCKCSLTLAGFPISSEFHAIRTPAVKTANSVTAHVFTSSVTVRTLVYIWRDKTERKKKEKHWACCWKHTKNNNKLIKLSNFSTENNVDAIVHKLLDHFDLKVTHFFIIKYVVIWCTFSLIILLHHPPGQSFFILNTFFFPAWCLDRRKAFCNNLSSLMSSNRTFCGHFSMLAKKCHHTDINKWTTQTNTHQLSDSGNKSKLLQTTAFCSTASHQGHTRWVWNSESTNA